MSDATRILAQVEAGDPVAAEQLLPLVYGELRRLAAAKLAQEQPGQTLQPTALVHEAYLRLVGGASEQETGNRGQETDAPLSNVSCPLSPVPSAPVPFDSRGHFFAAAAEAMRRILVDAARKRARQKRGAGAERLELHEHLLPSEASCQELLDLHEALDRLAEHDPQAAQLVKLRYFVGMQHQEAADVLGISRRAADGLWTLAKAWLRRELQAG
jgi:RNA polymerase sigma factor (sigma-70 family)